MSVLPRHLNLKPEAGLLPVRQLLQQLVLEGVLGLIVGHGLGLLPEGLEVLPPPLGPGLPQPADPAVPDRLQQGYFIVEAKTKSSGGESLFLL